MAQEKLEQLRNAVNELKDRKGYTNSWLSEIASKKGNKIPDSRMSNILSGKESGGTAFEVLSDIAFYYRLKLVQKGKFMQRKNLKNDTDYPLIMTRELAAEFIGVSGPTFDKYYRYAHNFPVVKNGDVEEAFPRDPIIKWIADNWQLLEKRRKR